MTLLLNNKEIAHLITMRECIDVLEDGYREHGLGRVAHRRRSNIVVPTGEKRVLFPLVDHGFQTSWSI